MTCLFAAINVVPVPMVQHDAVVALRHFTHLYMLFVSFCKLSLTGPNCYSRPASSNSSNSSTKPSTQGTMSHCSMRMTLSFSIAPSCAFAGFLDIAPMFDSEPALLCVVRILDCSCLEFCCQQMGHH